MNQHDMVRTLMTFDDQLDDIKRARIWSQLEDKLEADVAPRSRRHRWPLAVTAALAAAAAIVLLVRSSPDDAKTLAVPAGTTVTSQIGPHTRAAVVGPAQLELVGAAGEQTTVRVRSGTLLADFAGGPGRSLRIETRGAVVEVVGTVFSVEARGAVTCTSVVHGRVRVTTTSAVQYVGAGERFCTDEGLRAIDAHVREALERHQMVITAHATPAAPSASSTPIETPAAPIASSTSTVAPTPPTANATASTSMASPRTSTSQASPRTSTSHASPAASPRASTTVASPSRSSAPSPTTASPRASTAAASPSPTTPSPHEATSIAASPSTAPSSTTSSPPPPAVAASSSAPPATDVAPAPAKPRATADELYRTAEQALAARDPKTADRVLATLVAEYPASSLVDQAHYDRARIAYQQRAWTVARGHLDRLAAIGGTRLAEPGHYLRCRISVEARDSGAAAACFVEYRTRFPRAPHDVEALGVLAQHTYAKGGCAQASAFVGELASTYPRTTLAAAWRTRCPESRR